MNVQPTAPSGKEMQKSVALLSIRSEIVCVGENMSAKDELLNALKPIVDFVSGLDSSAPLAQQQLNSQFPLQAEPMLHIRQLIRQGIEERWLCDREHEGVRFSRVHKSSGTDVSIDAVHMAGPGAGHLHPNGEFDLCFAVSGQPRFDGHAEGWVVYPPNSWHIPTVTSGVMDILYFLPAGEIRFSPKPAPA
jgi:hypothetical protein